MSGTTARWEAHQPPNSFVCVLIVMVFNPSRSHIMSVGDFRILEQKSNEFGVTNISFEFSITEGSVSKIDLLFCVDLTDTDHTREVQVDAALDEETRNGKTVILVAITDFSFSADLSVDELTNFGGLKVICELCDDKKCEFMIPAYCSFSGQGVQIELMDP